MCCAVACVPLYVVSSLHLCYTFCCLIAAEITSDFEVRRIKPYTVLAQWIMSEKYKGVTIKFSIVFIGRPGYMKTNGEYGYIADAPNETGKCLLDLI